MDKPNHKLSLRFAIFSSLFTIVALITFVYGVIEYIENRITVSEYSEAFVKEKRQTISNVLNTRFKTQANIDQLAASSIARLYESGGIANVENYLLNNLKYFDEISAAFFTTTENEFSGYIRQQDYLHMYANEDTDFSIVFSRLSNDFQDGTIVNRVAGFYATERPWYGSALETSTQGFSSVFTYHAYATLALPHSLPVYNGNGELLGVVGSNIFLGEFGGFLRDQMQPFNGVAVVLDNKDRIIATSLDVSPIIANENRSMMIDANAHENPFVQQAYRRSALTGLTELTINNTTYKSASFAFDDIRHLNWKVTLFVPEQAFHTSVNQLLWQIAAILFLSLFIAGLLSMWLSSSLSQPITHLINRFSNIDEDLTNMDTRQTSFIELQEVSDLKVSIVAYHRLINRNIASLKEKAAENQLQLMQIRQLAVVSQSINDMSMIISRACEFEWANKPFYEYFGVNEDAIYRQLIGRFNLVDSAKRQMLLELHEHIQTSLNGELPDDFSAVINETEHMEFRFFSVKDDQEEKLLVLIRDVTEQKRYEEQLAIWKRIFESTRIGIAISLKNNQYVDIVNPAFAAMYGGKVKDFEGCNISRFYPKGQKTNPEAFLRRVKEQGGITTEAEHVRTNGEVFPVLMSITLVYNKTGDIIGRVTMVSDLTEPKQLQKQLFQSQKLHAIGSLAGGIVHDMNNVLGAIQSNAELGMLNTQIAKSEAEIKSHDIFSRISQASIRGSKLTQQVMSFSRMENVQTAPVPIKQLLADTVDLFKSSITRNIDVSVTLTLSEKDAIEGNESQLQQVFMNLLNNAFKAIQKAKRDTGRIVVNARVETDLSLCITISDNGCGVAPQDQPFIFDPFFTTEPKGKGTGLGLAIVERIVAAHNGEIRLISEQNEGSKFELCFNEVFQCNSQKIESKPTELSVSSDQHIVVIDDDAAVLNVWTELLQFKEYQVTAFLDSEQALAFCIDPQNHIDCVFTDFDMPKLNGKGFCEALRKHNNSVKIIMATGYSEVLSESKIAELNISKLLYKPISFDRFLTEITDILDVSAK